MTHNSNNNHKKRRNKVRFFHTLMLNFKTQIFMFDYAAAIKVQHMNESSVLKQITDQSRRDRFIFFVWFHFIFCVTKRARRRATKTRQTLVSSPSARYINTRLEFKLKSSKLSGSNAAKLKSQPTGQQLFSLKSCYYETGNY